MLHILILSLISLAISIQTRTTNDPDTVLSVITESIITIHKRNLDNVVELNLPPDNEIPDQRYGVVPYYLSPDPKRSFLFHISLSEETKLFLIAGFLYIIAFFSGVIQGDVVMASGLFPILLGKTLEDLFSSNERIPDINDKNFNMATKKTILMLLTLLFVFANLDSSFIAHIFPNYHNSRKYNSACKNFKFELIGDSTMDFKFGNKVIGQFYFESGEKNNEIFGFIGNDPILEKINPNGISEISFLIQPNSKPKMKCSTYNPNSNVCKEIGVLALDAFLASQIDHNHSIEFHENVNKRYTNEFKICNDIFENAIISATMIKFRAHSIQCSNCVSKCKYFTKARCKNNYYCPILSTCVGRCWDACSGASVLDELEK
jgi:hypothetical protein